MQVTFVLDCSNCMLDYVKHFKNQVLKLVQEQTIKMEIAFVIYRANDDNNATSVATEVKSYGFKPSGSHKSDIFPPLRETTPLDKTSLLPIDVHSALAKALDFQWDPKVEKRILILIAKNPPHGVQYHELGALQDLYPDGPVYPTTNDVLKAVDDKKIAFFVLNIDNEMQHFCKALIHGHKKYTYKTIVHKWVKCMLVENEEDLTHKILDCIVGEQYPDDLKSNEEIEDPLRNKKEPKAKSKKSTKKTMPKKALPDYVEHKDERDALVGKMRWVKQSIERGDACYPVLVLSVNKPTVSIWDGESSRNIELTDLCQRSDLMGDARGLRKSDKGVKLLLKRSHAMQQTLIEERHRCKEQSEKSKASTKIKTKQIENLIHAKIGAHDNIKWMKKKDGGYQPVHVIQQGDLYSQHSKSFVLNMYNETLAIKSTYLYDRPPYTTAQHIANHVEQLDRLCANYPWKRAVKCGTTKCSWITAGGWLSSDKIHSGTILGVKEFHKHYDNTQYRVRRDDNRKTVLLWDHENDFKVLGSGDSTTQLKELQKTNDQLKSQNSTLTTTNNRLTSDIKRLKSTNSQSSWDIKQLNKQIETFKATVASLQSDNDHLLSRIRKSKKDIASQSEEINDLKMECHKAITRKDDFEKKFTAIHNVYDRLKEESDQLKQKNQEQRQLVTKLREDKLEDSSTLDLSRGFPPVQDIVNDFATLKSHYHVEAARPMKKVFKQRNKEYSKLRHYKSVCEILFDILIKSYGAMQEFETKQYRSFAESNELDIDNEKHKKRLEKMVKEAYNVLISKSKKDEARAILSDIKARYGMDGYLKDDTKLLQYIEQCIAICWLIVLVRDPILVIEPLQFDQSDEGIDFDDQFYIEGFGSEDNHPLSFVVWPSIVREDTEENISKITGVFVKEIPLWNKKKMRKMQAEKKEQDRDSDRKEDKDELEAKKKKEKKNKKEQKNKKEKAEHQEGDEEEGDEKEGDEEEEGKEDDRDGGLHGKNSIDRPMIATAPDDDPIKYDI